MKLRRYEIVAPEEALTPERLSEGLRHPAVLRWMWARHREHAAHIHCLLWLRDSYGGKYAAGWFGLEEACARRMPPFSSPEAYLLRDGETLLDAAALHAGPDALPIPTGDGESGLRDGYIGLDLGTTCVRAVLFDGEGVPLREASRAVPVTRPGMGLVEQAPEAWYEIPCQVLRELTRGPEPCRVRALGISSQGLSFVPVDAAGRPLRQGISWLDHRADAELRELLGRVPAAEFLRRTGKRPADSYLLPKLLWLRKHEPEVFVAADAFLMPMDYFLSRAVGERVTDPTMAAGAMLFDLDEGNWSGHLAAQAGVEPGKLARVRPTGSAAGTLNAETRRRTGLGPVVAALGAQDQKSRAYGARLEPGTATLFLGDVCVTEALCPGRSAALPNFPYADGRQLCVEGYRDTLSEAMRWVPDTLCPGLSRSELEGMAARATPGCGGVRFVPRLDGTGGWSGIRPETGKPELLRAALEGLACEIRLLLEEYDRAGASLRLLRVFGEHSGGELCCRILAGICGLPVHALRCPELAVLGAARAAAEAVGANTDRFGVRQPVRVFAPEEASAGQAIFDTYPGRIRENDKEDFT